METKPFSIQSPEAIAKEYGGNKQKIAQAMQMGIIDPTAGTLAGMFIDRMRSAAQQEQAPQQTIAQQVMAPQPQAAPPAPPAGPPAGLGATPEAAQMMALPAMGEPQPMEQPMEQPMGMAAGGMLPPYMANNGLADLPVPDGMFDEPHDGSYAGGGIVAFAAGEEVKAKTPEQLAAEAKAKLLEGDGPEQLGGFYRDPRRNMQVLQEMAPTETAARDRATSLFSGILDPEKQKKRASEDKWLALAQLGSTMASTPGSLLQALSAGVASALPGIKEASKERRAEVRDAVMQMAEIEGLNNRDKRELARDALSGTKTYAELEDKAKQLKQEAQLKLLTEAGDTDRTRMLIGGRIQEALIAAGAKDKDSLVPTYGQLVDLSTQNKNLMKDAIEGMAEAEKSGNYADFKAARGQYAAAFRNYNQTAKLLGQEKIPSIAVNRFPKMALLAEKEGPKPGTPPTGTAGKGTPRVSQNMLDADKIIGLSSSD